MAAARSTATSDLYRVEQQGVQNLTQALLDQKHARAMEQQEAPAMEIQQQVRQGTGWSHTGTWMREKPIERYLRTKPRAEESKC